MLLAQEDPEQEKAHSQDPSFEVFLHEMEECVNTLHGIIGDYQQRDTIRSSFHNLP